MKKYPKISIVTPSYNQGQFLEETILSIISQNYPNLEYIIIDGGSTDDSVDIIDKYKDRLTYWVSEKDQGQTHAINKGLKKATGEIMNWINSDDLLTPGALQAVGQMFADFPESEFCFGDFDVIDKGGQMIFSRKSPPYHYRQLFYGRQFSYQPAVFFRRHVLEKIGRLDETLNFCMDLEFWIRATRQGCTFHQIKKPLALARMHGDAKTTLLQNVLHEEHKSVVKKYGGLGLAESSAIEDQCYTFLNRFWRFVAAVNRCICRGDWTFGRAYKALKSVQRTASHLR